jgi:hypothetical protein
MGNIEIILPSGTGDASIVDSMGGAVMIAGETTGTTAIMEPGRRCARDVVDRTDLSTFATSDAGIGINHELAISNHVLVEVCPQHIGVEARGGSTLEFLYATFAVPDDGNDVGCLSLGILNLPGFLLWCVCIHKRQADITLRHDNREECLCLKTNGE